MKFFALFAVLCVIFMASAVSGEESGATHVSGNNIKNFVSVGLDANAVVSNQVERNIVNVLLALLNQQAVVAGDQSDA